MGQRVTKQNAQVNKERKLGEEVKTEIRAPDKRTMANELQFHYREWGRPGARPLLLLHGLTGHAWEFDSIASARSNQFRVLAVNQRGHQASSWARGAFGRCHGGRYRRTHRCSRTRQRADHRQEIRAFVLNNLKQGPDGRWIWRFDARGLVTWMERASARGEMHWTALRKLACPTLVNGAGESPFTRAPAVERMAREIPRARLVTIPGAGHDIHIDQCDALLAELRVFLTAS